MIGGNGGQHAGRHGPQAAALRHLPSLVTVSRLLLFQYRLSPLVGNRLSSPVTSRLSPPPVPSPRLRHHPHGTEYHRFRLDGDGELHTYRWSSVLLTAHRLASRLALEPLRAFMG